jgi:hypothetical protein
VGFQKPGGGNATSIGGVPVTGPPVPGSVLVNSGSVYAPETIDDLFAGIPTVAEYTVSFNAAGLYTTGVGLFVPTAPMLVTDVAIDIGTAWDGTTPLGDIGAFDALTSGWFGFGGAAVDMTKAGAEHGNARMLYANGNAPLSRAATSAVPLFPDVGETVRFLISQTGLKGGAAPGSTKGICTIFVTSVPGL